MAYRQIWEVEIRHEGLNKYRHIKGSDKYIVEQKALAQRLSWDEMWEKRLEIEDRKNSKLEIFRSKFNKTESATARTKEAEDNIKSLETILSHTLKVNDTIVWETLIDKKPYTKEQPEKPAAPVISPAPIQSSSKYQPVFSFMDNFFSKSKKEKERIAQELFAKDMADWNTVKKLTEVNTKAAESQWAEAVKAWEKDTPYFDDFIIQKFSKILC